jgi:hypothetical protein
MSSHIYAIQNCPYQLQTSCDECPLTIKLKGAHRGISEKGSVVCSLAVLRHAALHCHLFEGGGKSGGYQYAGVVIHRGEVLQRQEDTVADPGICTGGGSVCENKIV